MPGTVFDVDLELSRRPNRGLKLENQYPKAKPQSPSPSQTFPEVRWHRAYKFG